MEGFLNGILVAFAQVKNARLPLAPLSAYSFEHLHILYRFAMNMRHVTDRPTALTLGLLPDCPLLSLVLVLVLVLILEYSTHTRTRPLFFTL